jgi:hypothetical protein
MLWTIVLPLVSKIVLALAIFASQIISKQIDGGLGVASIIMLALVFIVLQAQFKDLMRKWKTKTAGEDVFYNTVNNFVSAHWQTFTFVLTNWLVTIFENWWKIAEDPITGVVVVNTPLFFLMVLVEYVRPTRVSKWRIDKIMDDMLGRIIFSIGFFAATVIADNIKLQVDTWNWMLIILAFVAAKGAISFTLSKWDTSKFVQDDGVVYGEGSLKLAIERNVYLITMTFVFFLANLFSSIIERWWSEAETAVIGVVILSTILTLLLGMVVFVSEHKRFGSAFPRGIIDRALFATALFMAERADEGFVPLGEWYLLWLFIGTMLLFYSKTFLFEKWKISASDSIKDFRLTISHVLDTWLSIGVSFTVRLVVQVFSRLWRDEESVVVSAIICEITLLLLVLSVQVLEPKEESNSSKNQ